MIRGLHTLVLCAFLLLVAASASCVGGDKIPVTTTSEEARSHFLAGRTLVDNLRLTDAIADFQKAVEKDPNFALAYLYLAQTAPTPREFFVNLDKAVALAPNVSEGERFWILGVRSAASGDPASQKEYLKKLVQSFPGDERAHTLLGILYFGQQEYPEAVTCYEKAIKIEPMFAPAYNQLGYAYRFLEQYKDAERTFKKYTEIIPGDPNPYDSYAELLLKLGRFDEAVTQYRKALSVDDHFANARTGVAAALMYQGKHQGAREELDKAYRLARTDAEKRVALFAAAVTYVDEGDLQGALQEMDKQYTLGWEKGDAPAMAGDLIAIGNILLEKGSADDAAARYEKALAAVKASSLADDVKENAALFFNYNAARAAIGQKNVAHAMKLSDLFWKGAEKKKNMNQMRLAHELKGMLALEQKEYSKAAKELLQSNLQNPYNLYRIALAYQGDGEYAKAKEYAKKAAKFNSLPALNYAFVRTKAEALLSTLAKIGVG